MQAERILGVDFSAAKSEAGRRTWVAEASVTGDGLVLADLADAATYFDCDPSRGATLGALASALRSGGEPRVVGLDFPFSLPEPLLDGGDWRGFVAGTPERWGRLDADSPRDLYDAATTYAETEGVRLTRVTDEARGGQPPTGFRIRTQTFYGVSRVLRAIEDDVAVVPMDDPTDAGTVVVETYPAALFEAVDGHRTGYKRDTRDGIGRRRRNVERLRDCGVAFEGLADFATATDDALDAVAAAVAAWRAARNGFAVDDGGTDADVDEATYEAEGYMYA
ncbi:MAG: DUF429 domain-containing protein [Haloferacaceae archaeon]